ncbi:tape measure protein [Tautonia plasticadhaerens]|uniref:Tape measure protein N-terminal domain-containing protein n=1 Tax=Tautonia plasticadhaerens TaxID=2527974 RepID=A0A518H225_9BACT|nr:tape measure protein [Tautonia plasticadhaerens]QDV34899.1 hypothetical protein ElP_27960 [Tautonia plasticadhaerens]
MATLSELTVKIKADASQLDREMKKATTVTENAGKKMGASMGQFRVQLAAISSLLAGGKLIDGITKFEKIEASLRTVTGSAENAAAAFGMIQKFAATTPFAVEEVANAFIKLKSLGLDPSEKALLSYGNTASAMGKSLNQVVEAVADAATGEFERLKEFGIRTKDAGDSVIFTFQGMETKVRKNAAGIEGYIRSIGDVQFAGAIKEQESTLSVALSNMGDSFDQLAKTIGDAGLTALIKGVADEIKNLTLTANENIPKFKQGFNAIVGGIAMQFTDDPAVKQALLDELMAQNDAPTVPSIDVTGNRPKGGGGSFGKSGKTKKKKEAEDYDEAGDALSNLLLKYEQEAELAQLSGRALAERRAEMEATAQAIKDKTLGTSQELIDKIREQAGVTYEAEEATKQITKAQEEAAETAREWRKELTDGLTDIILHFDSAGDAAKRFFDEIAAQILKKSVTGPLSDGIMGAIEGTDIFKSIGGFLSGARADGGPVGGGKSYLVGERGPEIFTPSVSGQIIPNHQMGGGGITIVQNNSFGSGVTRSEVAGMLPGIISATKQAVATEVQKGGAFTRQIRG